MGRMNGLTVIITIFAVGPVLAGTFLTWDEWRQWRLRRAALRRSLS